MRILQTIPDSLLIAWYELLTLTSSIQHETELSTTYKKVLDLLDIADLTAA